MDCCSRFIEIAFMSRITRKLVVMKLKNTFARWGIPEALVSDNGSQFVSSEFVSFSKEYGFKCSTSSPHHPQGNGEAESGVCIAKRILRQKDPFLALMSYRETPILKLQKQLQACDGTSNSNDMQYTNTRNEPTTEVA